MKTSRHEILQFPIERTSHLARGGSTTFESLKSRLREAVGRVANRLGLPGIVQPVEIYDQATGQRITIAVGSIMVRLTIDGRDFFFDRLTGRFDGAGSTVA
jgi:hypothetical protein